MYSNKLSFLTTTLRLRAFARGYLEKNVKFLMIQKYLF